MVNSHILPKAEWKTENPATTNKVKKKVRTWCGGWQSPQVCVSGNVNSILGVLSISLCIRSSFDNFRWLNFLYVIALQNQGPISEFSNLSCRPNARHWFLPFGLPEIGRDRKKIKRNTRNSWKCSIWWKMSPIYAISIWYYGISHDSR